MPIANFQIVDLIFSWKRIDNRQSPIVWVATVSYRICLQSAFLRPLDSDLGSDLKSLLASQRKSFRDRHGARRKTQETTSLPGAVLRLA
jgi:hypothetical protein